MNKMFLFVGSLLIAFLFSFSSVSAGSSHNMTGWAWSSNIGWISFNSSNDHDPVTAGIQSSPVDYGVNIAPDGTLTGYAWSSNIGWIQFGGLSGFPTASGVSTGNARMTGNTLYGWVKALSASGTSGWDGWISLFASVGGTSYGLNYNVVKQANGSLKGYAWGDDVVGWIKFDTSTATPETCAATGNCPVVVIDNTMNLTLGVKNASGVSIAGSTSVPHNTVPTFNWTLSNLPVGTSCTLTKPAPHCGGTAFTPVNDITTSGSGSGSALTGVPDMPPIGGSCPFDRVPYSYKLQCSNGMSSTVGFTVLPPAVPEGGFTLEADDMDLSFFSTGGGESTISTIRVNPVTFSAPITLSISQLLTPSVTDTASTTYSINNGPFVDIPGSITLNPPYADTKLQIKVNKPIPVQEYTIKVTGLEQGGSASDEETIIVNPKKFIPTFEEI